MDKLCQIWVRGPKCKEINIGAVDGTLGTDPHSAAQRKFKLKHWGSSRGQPSNDQTYVAEIRYYTIDRDAYLRVLEHVGLNPPEVSRALAEADVIALKAEIVQRDKAIESAQNKALRARARLTETERRLAKLEAG
jgi:hypothetical protein